MPSSPETNSEFSEPLPTPDPAPSPSFEEALKDLQHIVADLESGAITLDASLKRFEQGIELLRQCYQFLDRTDQRIEQLVSLDASGNCTLVPFDATATVDKPAKAAPAKPAAKRTPRVKEAVEPNVDSAPAADDPELPGKLLF